MYTLNKKNQIQQNYVLIQLKKLSVWENSGEEGGDFFFSISMIIITHAISVNKQH